MKQRLIDANKLRKDFLDLPDCYNGFSDTYDKALIIGVIDEQPTVDAVEVVRCKDCVHNQLPSTSGNVNCELWYGMTNLYGYCSRGERKKMEDER